MSSILNPDLQIKVFSYKDAHLLSRLKKEIEKESEHLLVKKHERHENALQLIVKLLVSQRRVVTFLAFYKNVDVGYVSLIFPKFTKLKGNVYLTIAIREKYRGKGIGSALMERAEDYARAKNIRRVELEVFSKNKNAIGLYTKRNYEIEGTKKDAIEEVNGFDDIIIMTKRLR